MYFGFDIDKNEEEGLYLLNKAAEEKNIYAIFFTLGLSSDKQYQKQMLEKLLTDKDYGECGYNLQPKKLQVWKDFYNIKEELSCTLKQKNNKVGFSI